MAWRPSDAAVGPLRAPGACGGLAVPAPVAPLVPLAGIGRRTAGGVPDDPLAATTLQLRPASRRPLTPPQMLTEE